MLDPRILISLGLILLGFVALVVVVDRVEGRSTSKRGPKCPSCGSRRTRFLGARPRRKGAPDSRHTIRSFHCRKCGHNWND